MPLEVKIPKEITEYKEKIMFGLSIRQLISIIVAAIVCIVTFIITKRFIGSDLAGYLVLVEAAPIVGVGFVRINGFTFERYISIVINHAFGRSIRVYKTELSVDYLDYYGDFGMTVSTAEELVSRVKSEKFSGIRNEAAAANLKVSEKNNQSKSKK